MHEVNKLYCRRFLNLTVCLVHSRHERTTGNSEYHSIIIPVIMIDPLFIDQFGRSTEDVLDPTDGDQSLRPLDC